MRIKLFKRIVLLIFLLTFSEIVFILILGFPAIGTAEPEYTKVWGSSGIGDIGTVYSLWIEDTDNDTKDEIIAGAHLYGGGLWVFETDGDNSFTNVWNMPGSTWYAVTAGDADQDGKREIIGGGREDWPPHYVYVYEWTGTVGQNSYDLVWSYGFNGYVEGARVTDDLDKDEIREIVVGSGDGIVSVFECTGNDTYTLEWSFDATALGVMGLRGIAVGDIDNDGWIEIAVEGEGHVLVLNSSTHQATPHLEWGPVTLPSIPGAWDAIDVSIEKDGLSQDLDNDTFKEIVVGGYDSVAIYENLAPDFYNSTPVEITFADTNNIEVDIAWDLDNNTKNELLTGGGYPGYTYNVSIFEFGSTLDDITLVFTMTAAESPNSIRASESFCHRDLDQEIVNLQGDKGYWEFVIGLYYTAIDDLQVWESNVLAGHWGSIFKFSHPETIPIYQVHLEVDTYFSRGYYLLTEFYSYGDIYEGSVTVWYGSTPADVVLSMDVTHPQGEGIGKVYLVLRDINMNKIQTLTSFTMTRRDLFKRLIYLDFKWPYVSPDERSAIMNEITDIDIQWIYAPS